MLGEALKESTIEEKYIVAQEVVDVWFQMFDAHQLYCLIEYMKEKHGEMCQHVDQGN